MFINFFSKSEVLEGGTLRKSLSDCLKLYFAKNPEWLSETVLPCVKCPSRTVLSKLYFHALSACPELYFAGY